MAMILGEDGTRVMLTPSWHLQQVREDVLSLLKEGSLDRAVYDEYLANYTYALPGDWEARSVAVAAVPSQPMKVVFHHPEGDIETLVPPTYAHAQEIDAQVMALLKGRLGAEARMERLFLPVKTLAARVGLVMYGRNNITYVPGQGSFFRLTSFITDVEVPDRWGERRLLPACASCRKCLQACPTQAIVEDRMLIHAERCLTFWNEKPDPQGFPPFIGTGAHNALVGCMVCQMVCPYDRSVLDRTEVGGSFSEEETLHLLGDAADDLVRELVERKLQRLGMDRSVFPRNLVALMPRR